MKKSFTIVLIALIAVFVFVLTGCDAVSDIFDVGGSNNNDDDGQQYDEELASSTGKWYLLGDDDTYFNFDGAKNVMSFSYVEDGLNKYSGTYRVISKGVGEDVRTPLTFIFTRTDKSKEDWLSCYVEDFDTDFTQFTIMDVEEDLGMTDGFIYTHVYRISELPYKMGTYILEGKEYKAESNNYSLADERYIASGTYSLGSGESFTFLTIKPRGRELFQYKNGDVMVEGTYTLSSDKKTIYLYVSHDPYSKVTNADKAVYDTTFDIYYPPDIYLRGDYSSAGSFVINDLYHHTSSPITTPDSIWTYGTYTLAE